MAESIGLSVVNLHRVSFGGITLKGLSKGDWLELNENEIQIVKQAMSLEEKRKGTETIGKDLDEYEE